MAAPVLPSALVVPTRDDLQSRFKRDLQIAAARGGASIAVATGSLGDIESKVYADAMLPIYAEAARQSATGTLDGKSLSELKQEAKDSGLTEQLPAAGASGFVIAAGATGGGFVTAGGEFRNLATGKRYMSLVSGLYKPGDLVAVAGIDTGPSSNVDAGTTLTWTSPPPGIDASAVVFEESDGSGLTGGRDAETAQEIADRIRASRANPAASGNDAAYQAAAMSTPGIAIQAAFTYPAIVGPGSTCLLFLLRPSAIGGSRIPNNAQIGLVKGYVTTQMPKGDSATFGVVIPQSTDLVITVVWANGVAQWTDGVPWPPYSSFDTYKVTNDTTATATSFSVGTSDPGYIAPQVGQTIGLFDRTNLVFVEKRIRTVATVSPGHWTLTIDTTDNASDTQFTPAVGDLVSPWSDSLNTLPGLVATYFDGLGPGEQVASFFDQGYRQRRSPVDPQFWPSSLTTKVLIPILELSSINDAEIKSPTLPFSPTVGTPGVSSNLLTLGRFAVFAG